MVIVNLMLLLVFLMGLWLIGLSRYVDDIPAAVEDKTTRTDAIVVLTGGSGRLSKGLDLLSKNLADLMFVSGVYRGLDVRHLLQVVHHNPTRLEKRIDIGNAINTRENAEETARWVAEKKISSLRLVTAAYHMPRSQLEFNNLMPNIRIIANPVFPKHVKHSEWWSWPGTATLMATEFNKFLMAWVRHRTENMFMSDTKRD
ncbi:MAG: hypothetical protein CMF69_12270 [Magnetovibrio sp.]|nr:hypothetical protein [Magnetovibrio sp.]|tara:strand:+ start:298 stop:900 length:603 start_codon:yes stop_codon:yes gene_type:complete